MLSLLRQIAKTVVSIGSVVAIIVLSVPLIIFLIVWALGTFGQLLLLFPDWLRVVLIPTPFLIALRYLKDII